MDLRVDPQTGRLMAYNLPVNEVTGSQIVYTTVSTYDNLLGLDVQQETLVYVKESQGSGLLVSQGGTFRPSGLYIFKGGVWDTNADAVIASTSYSLSTVTSTAVAYVVLVEDSFIECTSGSFTVTLPTAITNKGKVYTISNTGTGIITLMPYGTELIHGDTSQVIYSDETFVVISNGTNWIVI